MRLDQSRADRGEAAAARLRASEEERPKLGAGALDPIRQAAPAVRDMAAANHRFILRAIRFLIADVGISQFIDLGSAAPAAADIRAAILGHSSDTRTVYVQDGAFTSALRRAAPRGRAGFVSADPDDPSAFLSHPVLREYLDFAAPVAVVSAAFPRFRPAGTAVSRLAAACYDAMAVGTHLVISYPTAAAEGREGPSRVGDVSEPTDILARFDRFEVVEPGLADVSWWPYSDDDVTGPGTGIVGGIGRKR